MNKSTSVGRPLIPSTTLNPLLSELFSTLAQTRTEQANAESEARHALPRLVSHCAKHLHEERTGLLRRFLYSAFNQRGLCNLNDLQLCEWPVRKDLLAVLLAVGTPGFADFEIRSAFIDQDLGDWFLEEANAHHEP